MAESNKTQVEQSISLAFPTLIGQFKFQNSDSVNAGLLKQVLAKESSDASQQYANAGGWHSKGDLLEWPGSEVAQLRSWIGESLNAIVGATGQLPEVRGRPAPKGRFRLTGWANVSRIGNYHRMHLHPQSAWSGVYYLTESRSEIPLDGVLELYDPRHFAEMVDAPGAPYGQRVHIRPQAGLMVLFPSWLYHFVHPCKTEATRVSVAFNAAWIPEH
ncbi:MAG TPA: hypothetical protein DDW52_30130 [Planctomycetaceae bacterium]|nr:hypothetical protein [Planctomycetaceae bacterium]